MHSRCVEWNNKRNLAMATSLVLMQRGEGEGEVCRRGCCYQWSLDSAAAANIPSSHGIRTLTFNLTDSRSSAPFNEFLSLLSFRGDARFETSRFSRVFFLPRVQNGDRLSRKILSIVVSYTFLIFLSSFRRQLLFKMFKVAMILRARASKMISYANYKNVMF